MLKETNPKRIERRRGGGGVMEAAATACGVMATQTRDGRKGGRIADSPDPIWVS